MTRVLNFAFFVLYPFIGQDLSSGEGQDPFADGVLFSPCANLLPPAVFFFSLLFSLNHSIFLSLIFFCRGLLASCYFRYVFLESRWPQGFCNKGRVHWFCGCFYRPDLILCNHVHYVMVFRIDVFPANVVLCQPSLPLVHGAFIFIKDCCRVLPNLQFVQHSS